MAPQMSCPSEDPEEILKCESSKVGSPRTPELSNSRTSELPLTVKELPPEMQPREEFLRSGARGVPLETLLAILLRTGVPGMNVSELARYLLARFQGLDRLFEADYEHLRNLKIKGLGPVKCMELAAALEIGRRAMLEQQAHGRRRDDLPLKTPESIYRIIEPFARDLKQEVFWVVLLDTKMRIIGHPVETVRGLLDSTAVHAREIFSKAVRYNAASLILIHNHPSGDPTPSKQDLDITCRLTSAAHVLGIRVMDHLVVGKPSPTSPGYVSMSERGLADFG